MVEWISTNFATIIAAAILLIIIVLIIRSKVRERKQGGCGCGCPGCSGSCPHTVSNRNKTEEKTNEA